MKDAAALATIQTLAAAGSVSFVVGDIIHFLSGLGSFDDVLCALASATSCETYSADASAWLVLGGVDLQGEGLRVVVRIEEGVLVIAVDRERGSR